MSYNFDKDYTKYLKFRKKKLRKLFRKTRGENYHNIIFSTRKRKNMLLGIFVSYVSKNLKSYNGALFVTGGQYDYSYDDEGEYNVFYLTDTREITIYPQTTLLLDYVSYATNYIMGNVHEDSFSYNYFTFIGTNNDWDLSNLYPGVVLAKNRYDNLYAFDLFGTIVERWYHFANPLLGSNPSLKGDLWKYTHIYRGRPPYTLNDRAEWLNDRYRYLHEFFKYGDARYNFFTDHFIDIYFLKTLFNLPPLDLGDNKKFKNLKKKN